MPERDSPERACVPPFLQGGGATLLPSKTTAGVRMREILWIAQLHRSDESNVRSALEPAAIPFSFLPEFRRLFA